MRWALLVLALLLIPSALAGVDAQFVHVQIGTNGVVREEVTLRVTAPEPFEVIEYTLSQEPAAVITDVPYSLVPTDDGTLLVLEQPLETGTATVTFTLIYDDIILEQDSVNAYSIELEPENGVLVSLAVTLPEEAVLADLNPAVLPPPDSMTTDGRRMTLSWESEGRLGIIVLYELPSERWMGGVVVLLIGIGALVVFSFFRKKRSRKALHGTLGPDEQLVLDLVRKGVTKQNALCKESGFSKSKMSKVIRKLEQKGAVEKSPHHKTNELRLRSGW